MPAYLWVTELDNTQPNQVKIGATSAESAQNRVDAINANPATAGTAFSFPTQENAAFSATRSGLVITVVAKQPGAIGNTYGLTETEANFAWSGATASGGSDGTTTALTVGVEGAGAGQGLSYTRGSQVVTTPTAPAGGTSLYVSYYRLGADCIVGENSAIVSARAAIEHGTGRADALLTDSSNADPVAGLLELQAALSQFGELPDQLTLNSIYEAGLSPGQWLSLLIDNPEIIAQLYAGNWQIQDVKGVYMPGEGRFKFAVTLTSSTTADWLRVWTDMGKK